MKDSLTHSNFIPGEYSLCDKDIEINKNRHSVKISVTNTGDRPVQVGSHYHFFEVNKKLSFNREQSIGMHLNILSGNAIRFEPGEEKEVSLVSFSGKKVVYGFHGLIQGPLDEVNTVDLCNIAKQQGFLFSYDDSQINIHDDKSSKGDAS